MSESKETKVSKKNPILNYFQESYEELRKVTWPTRNQAMKLTFIVIGFCIVLAMIVGVLDFAFNTGYRTLVNYSEKFAPPAATTSTSPVTSTVATGEPTSNVDLSNIKIVPSSTSGSTQQK